MGLDRLQGLGDGGVGGLDRVALGPGAGVDRLGLRLGPGGVEVEPVPVDPVEGAEALVAQLALLDRAPDQGLDLDHRHAARIDAEHLQAVPLGSEADPQGRVPGAEDAHPAPVEGQDRPRLARLGFGAGENAGVKGRVKERRVDRKAPGRLVLALRQGGLGVDVLTVAPGRPQSLEGGAVFEARLGEALIEVGGIEGLGSRRGPLGEGRGGRGCHGGEGAGGVEGPLPSPSSSAWAAGREWIEIALVPSPSPSPSSSSSPSAAARVTWIWTEPWAAKRSGACRVSSSMWGAPPSWPAARASSTKAVPGSRTVPITA